jgi:hypothetical protein
MSPACQASIDEMNESLGGYFFYSLYDDCIYDEPYRRRRLDEIDDPVDRELIALTMSEGRGGLNDYPCAGTVMSDWLDRPEVRAALNIQPDNRFNNAVRGKRHGFCAFFLTKLRPFAAKTGLGQTYRQNSSMKTVWLSQDNGVGMDYDSTERNLLPTYEYFRAETDLRVLVFNGDTDPGLNSMSTQASCSNSLFLNLLDLDDF